MKKYKIRWVLFILALLLVVFAGCSGTKEPADLKGKDEPKAENPVPVDNPQSTGIYNPLTGLYVEKTQNLTAVMIDNLGPARPQSGLIKADIIYEIEAEGMVTRLMALFYGDPPEFVGPVRSARPYYMQIAKEWDAYYAHVGGCDDSWAKLVEWKIRDIDDLKGHKGFYVDKTRQRPHSTYLKFADALSGKEENGKLKEWSFIDTPDSTPTYKEINFRYTSTNRVTYKWEDDLKAYLRFINDKPHDDRETGQQLSANNIILQYAVHRDLKTQLKHIWVDVIGKGKAEFFLGGQYFEGTWEKKSMTDPTVFYDDQGKPITLVRGQTWIQVLRPSAEVKKN
ncbi:MAG: DUF3048 domain-containing protein [Bacillota bacterium]